MLLTPEQEMIRDAVRDFSRRELWPHAARRDRESIFPHEAHRGLDMAKRFTREVAEKVCSAAIQPLGGYGVVNDFPLERICRDVRVCQIYEGTFGVQKIIIQRALA
jgi:alkylation response protein AidB-like acyl-CoA dehydrogenase